MEDGKIVERVAVSDIQPSTRSVDKRFLFITATHFRSSTETIIGHRAFAEQITNKWLVELSYVGNQTNEPLIAQLYSKYQVTANILYGNVELLQETPLGSLIVTLAGETNQRQKALDYLIRLGVRVNALQKNEENEQIPKLQKGEFDMSSLVEKISTECLLDSR